MEKEKRTIKITIRVKRLIKKMIKYNVYHYSLGKTNFEHDSLIDNFNMLYREIHRRGDRSIVKCDNEDVYISLIYKSKVYNYDYGTYDFKFFIKIDVKKINLEIYNRYLKERREKSNELRSKKN